MYSLCVLEVMVVSMCGCVCVMSYALPLTCVCVARVLCAFLYSLPRLWVFSPSLSASSS